MKKEIIILHSACCAKGSPIREQIEKVASENNIKVEVKELSDFNDTLKFGTLEFPSIVVNGKTHSYRKYNTDEDVLKIINK